MRQRSHRKVFGRGAGRAFGDGKVVQMAACRGRAIPHTESHTAPCAAIHGDHSRVLPIERRKVERVDSHHVGSGQTVGQQQEEQLGVAGVTLGPEVDAQALHWAVGCQRGQGGTGIAAVHGRGGKVEKQRTGTAAGVDEIPHHIGARDAGVRGVVDARPALGERRRRPHAVALEIVVIGQAQGTLGIKSTQGTQDHCQQKQDALPSHADVLIC